MEPKACTKFGSWYDNFKWHQRGITSLPNLRVPHWRKSSSSFDKPLFMFGSNLKSESKSMKICGCGLLFFLDCKLVLDWCGWLGVKNQRTNTIKTRAWKCVDNFFTIINQPHSIVNTLRRIHIYCLHVNKHAPPIIRTKQGKIQFSIWLMLMINCKFANACHFVFLFIFGHKLKIQ